MPPATEKTHPLDLAERPPHLARAPSGSMPAPVRRRPEATRAAVEHLGYVQIDTINVIERSPPPHPVHAHPRLSSARTSSGPERRQDGLRILDPCARLCGDQGHPVLPRAMKIHRCAPMRWFSDVEPVDVRRGARPHPGGPLSIRDIDDDGWSRRSCLGEPQAVQARAAIRHLAGTLTSARAPACSRPTS